MSESVAMVSSTKSLIIITSPVSSPLRARTVVTYVPTFTAESSFLSVDDSKVDYTSLLGLEDRRKRFSEEVVDMDLKDSVRLQKMYRQIQRQVHCREQNKGS